MGDKIAPLVGAGAGRVVVADSTSVNLFKVLSAALALVQQADAPQRARDRLRAQQLPDRPLHRREPGPRSTAATLRAGRARRDRPRTATTTLARADAHPRELPHRPHARHGGAHARRRTRRRAGGVGPGALGRRGAGGPDAAPTPTSRSAAATSTSTAAPARRPSSGRTRATRRMDRALWQPLSGWMGHAAPFEFTPRLPAGRRHRALRLRHAAGAVAGRAGVRRRHAARRRAARRHGGAARASRSR